MIVDFLVGLFAALFGAVLDLLPDFEMFDGPRTSGGHVSEGGFADYIGKMLGLWDLFFPVGTMFTCLLVVIGARVFVGVVQLLVFVYDKFPFKST